MTSRRTWPTTSRLPYSTGQPCRATPILTQLNLGVPSKMTGLLGVPSQLKRLPCVPSKMLGLPCVSSKILGLSCVPSKMLGLPGVPIKMLGLPGVPIKMLGHHRSVAALRCLTLFSRIPHGSCGIQYGWRWDRRTILRETGSSDNCSADNQHWAPRPPFSACTWRGKDFMLWGESQKNKAFLTEISKKEGD